MSTIVLMLMLASSAKAELSMNATTWPNDPSISSMTIGYSDINRSTRTMNSGEIVQSTNSGAGFSFGFFAATTTVIGVLVDDGVAVGASGRIATQGFVQVWNGSAATVRGRWIQASTVSGRAQSTAAPAAGSTVGIWWENCPANTKCWALLK